MSELTRCNYCTLQDMKRRAKARHAKVILSSEDGWVVARYSDDEKSEAHFLMLTDHCVCYG